MPARGLLVLVAASVATAAAVTVPALLADGGAGDGQEELAGGGSWSGARVCRTEPESGCVERGPATAERLAGLLLPLRPVPRDQVTCLAVGERYEVVLSGTAGDSAVLVVDTECGPLLSQGERYEVSEEARAAVAAAWAAEDTGG